jgi:ubiquinone/menaquinone biosynthesis C-methylase UbiE
VAELVKSSENMLAHFSQLAASYRYLRTTDLLPIMFMKGVLDGIEGFQAADIGCGAGRYCLKFFKHLGIGHLTCVDNNESMLRQTSSYLQAAGVTNFKTIMAVAEDIPLAAGSVDCVFSFNAIHHFDCLRFLKNAARAVRDGGYIFIYTRLKSQNARNIWGQYFPLFWEKENRLYEQDELERTIAMVASLSIEHVRYFRYRRVVSLDRLINLARRAHYSTFALYGADELSAAIAGFRDNIKRHFSDLKRIEWFDENTLLVLRKRGANILFKERG